MNNLIVAFDALSVQDKSESKTAQGADRENAGVNQEVVRMIESKDNSIKKVPQLRRIKFVIRDIRTVNRNSNERKPYDVEPSLDRIKWPGRGHTFRRAYRQESDCRVIYRIQLRRSSSMLKIKNTEEPEPTEKDNTKAMDID